MAKNCSFFLKDPNSKSETIVYYFFNFGYYELGTDGKKKYKPLKGSTGEKIKPSLWDAKKQRADKKLSGFSEFNFRLNKIESSLMDIHRNLLNNGIHPTPIEIKIEFDKRDGKYIPKVTSGLIQYVEKFIEQRKQTKKYNTIRSYKATLKQLQLYSKFSAHEMVKYSKLKDKEQDELFKSASVKQELSFENINLDFYYDFVKWNKEQGRSINYIGALIKNIKVFMTDAHEQGATTSQDFKSRHFKVIQEEADTIYLTEDEVKAIIELDLSANLRLDKVRDLFVIACHTGLRFSDFDKVRPENIADISGKCILQIETEKTGKPVAIPVMPIVSSIIAKYNGMLPRAISNQKMNAYIKEIGKLAKITSLTKGSKPKHELITTHTGRRTALTNMSLNGVPSVALMKISGHTTEKSFLKYLKMSATESAIRLMDLPYFQQGTLKAV